MASLSKGTSFTDGVTGDVTAAKLHALVDAATPVPGLITDRTAETSVASDDLVLIHDTSETALNKMTVANLMKAELTGTINSTAGTIATLNSTTGTIPTLVATTLLTTGTGTAASPAIVPTGDTNTGIFFPAADTIAFAEGGAEAMRIDSSGNVGIGTTSPNTVLQVGGTSSGAITIARNSSATNISIGALYFRNENVPADIALINSRTDGATNSGNLILHTASTGTLTERLRITSDGNVVIGATSSGAKFHTYNSGSTDARVAYFEKASGTTDGFYLICYAGVTTHFQVLGNGNCQNLNNSYAGISDEKLKQDIIDASSQWDDIKNLRVRKFRFKSDPSMPLHLGLVAQEAEQVSPNLIEETKDTDKEGNDLGTTTKAVKYSILYMKSVKALQEAMERIEQLESKVAALEAA